MRKKKKNFVFGAQELCDARYVTPAMALEEFVARPNARLAADPSRLLQVTTDQEDLRHKVEGPKAQGRVVED